MGVESNSTAIRDAMANAKENNVENIQFLSEDAAEYMGQVAKGKAIKPDVVILDPPRAGASEGFLKSLITTKPERVVYVSCDLGTLARDLEVLENGGYQVEKIQGVDMFAWSGHVETCVLLSKLGTENNI